MVSEETKKRQIIGPLLDTKFVSLAAHFLETNFVPKETTKRQFVSPISETIFVSD